MLNLDLNSYRLRSRLAILFSFSGVGLNLILPALHSRKDRNKASALDVKCVYMCGYLLYSFNPSQGFFLELFLKQISFKMN
jgi:hypothetical protein